MMPTRHHSASHKEQLTFPVRLPPTRSKHHHQSLASLTPIFITMVFIFGSSTRHSSVIESSIGDCQFCHSNNSIDLIQTHRQFWFWCCIPTPATTQRMVTCRACRKTIKAEYYYSTSNADILKDTKGKEGVEDEMVVMGTAV
jgi:hypothetical protein